MLERVCMVSSRSADRCVNEVSPTVDVDVVLLCLYIILIYVHIQYKVYIDQTVMQTFHPHTPL